MTNEEILSKSIDKAKKNGYKTVYSGEDLVDFLDDVYMEYGIKGDYSFIFSHNFAKAFFGKGEEIYDCEFCDVPNDFYLGMIPTWKHKLMQMVLEEDPIKYLEKFL